MKKIILSVVAVSVLATSIVGYLLVQKMNPSNAHPFDDSHLQISTISREDNGFYELLKLNNEATDSKSTIIDAALEKPRLQCEVDPWNALDDCFLIVTIAHYLKADAELLLSEGRTLDALNEVLKLLRFAQMVQNDANSDSIYFYSILGKREGLNLLDKLVSTQKFSAAEKSMIASRLLSVSDNKSGYKNAIKYEYKYTQQLINAISSGDYSEIVYVENEESRLLGGLDQEVFDELEKSKNSYTWKPEQTKLLFYEFHQAIYETIDSQCTNEETEITWQNFELHDLPPNEIENYIGKFFYSLFTSSYNDHRVMNCELDMLTANLQAKLNS